MLTRLWFSLSMLWAAAWLIMRCFETNSGERMIAFVIALAPFALGLLVRGVYSYTVTGRIRL